MGKSNVVANSNVLLFKKDYPWRDWQFMSEIEDYNLLKCYKEKLKGISSWEIGFTDKQKKILETEKRCFHAKDDPCWGYIDSLHKVVCKCKNGSCAHIYECNPMFSKEYETLWKPSELQAALYKNPESQRKYYLVDLISDEEMATYTPSPKYEGVSFPVKKDPWQEHSKYWRKTKIDPTTGRKMIVVGYHWVITDNGNYESEEMIPIWDYVNEVEVVQSPSIFKKAKKIEKRVLSKEDTTDFKQYKAIVKGKAVEKIKLIDFTESMLEGKSCVLLFDNPAELAFASNTFLTNNVKHGDGTQIELALIEDYYKFLNVESAIISNNGLEHTCNEDTELIWKYLSECNNIKIIDVIRRDYRELLYNGFKIWTCGNMYGVTHLCVDETDFELSCENNCDLEMVDLIYKDDQYVVYDEENGEIGVMTEEFRQKIIFLKDEEQIPGMPIKIEGLAIRISTNGKEVLGMGHLKFNEY